MPVGRAGEFGVWLVSTGRRLVRAGRSSPPTAAPATHASVTADVPVDSGYLAYVVYRPTAGAAWSI